MPGWHAGAEEEQLQKQMAEVQASIAAAREEELPRAQQKAAQAQSTALALAAEVHCTLTFQ
jgi:hypothetical protein